MDTQHVMKALNLLGVKKECLFKDFPVALPEARTELDHAAPIKDDDILLIAYKMTPVELHPDRAELFYYGKMIDGDPGSRNGLEFVQMANRSFVMTTFKGPLGHIWKGYQAINEYIEEHALVVDKEAYSVELYDSRFDPESDQSEMEIYIPVKE